MYGMINAAIRSFVTDTYGGEVWARVASHNTDVFVSMQSYPDEVTVELATSSARALDLDLDTFLEQFGRYWVDLARQGAYQDLFEMLGSSLPTVLQNLDAMHARIALSFPRLTPPRFWCSDVSESGFVLHYSSTRPGLTSFVVGLVRGLADYLHTRVTIEVTKRKVAGHTHDELRLTYIS